MLTVLKSKKEIYIAGLAVVGIILYLSSRFIFHVPPAIAPWPLWMVLFLGGVPLVWDLLIKLVKREFGSDLLAGISIVTSVFFGEYLAGTLVVLMLSGGQTLENFAVKKASSILEALAKRMPNIAHYKNQGILADISVQEIKIGDVLIVLPHESCPVDGTVVEGRGAMDESYLTGEPFVIEKTPGSQVLSGAMNGEVSLSIRADKLPVDSRYAKIMEVMRGAELKRPRIRRLGDQLGTFYTPLAVGIALMAGIVAQDPMRFLAVMVIATPCPLLIAIPVALIGSISLSARRGIIIRNPAILEEIENCRTMILDKTGTLTYGKPGLSKIIYSDGYSQDDALKYSASLERYSKHPLARAIVEAAQKAGVVLEDVAQISEAPGEGLRGVVQGHEVFLTSRKKLIKEGKGDFFKDIPAGHGLECMVTIDGKPASYFQFHDEPRQEGKSFIKHLGPLHHIKKVMIVSGDRESEVQYLAEKVGIDLVFAGKSPEEKIDIVRGETKKTKTIYLGDGINDAPALTAATVGIAFGQNSDITTEAAGAVIMESSLEKVDELMHISRRMRTVALQSAVGGMALSLIGMLVAAGGHLSPVAGAIAQETIDVLAVINALRVAFPPRQLTDFAV